VTFPRTHHLPRAASKLVVPHWSDVAPDDIEDRVAGKQRTLVDCMRMLRPDESLPIVIEAESFAWHGETAALSRDCVRYSAFTVAGWIVVRFSWFQVMFQTEYVLQVLEQVVHLAGRHANVARGSPQATA